MKRPISRILLGITLAAALAGCQRSNQDRSAEPSGQRPGTTAPGAGPADRAAEAVSHAAHKVATVVDNTTVTAKVKNALLITKGLDASHIDVHTTNGGVVELRGTVPTASQKTLAAKMASHIDGVREVRDELRVAPVTAKK
jgi:hypothetical protein